MKKLIINIIILLAIVVDFILVLNTRSSYETVVNKYDSIQTEIENFDMYKYKQFIIYCNLVDTLFNYHHNSISRNDLTDFFEYNNELYLGVLSQSQYNFCDTKISFSYRNHQLVCDFPLYYRLDSSNFVSKNDILFYLQNRYIK